MLPIGSHNLSQEDTNSNCSENEREDTNTIKSTDEKRARVEGRDKREK